MVKHGRKRQKVTHEGQSALGADELPKDLPEKDDEERRLESLLFGADFESADISKGGPWLLHQDTDIREDTPSVDNEMEHMLDSELFFIDDGNATTGLQETPKELRVAETTQPEAFASSSTSKAPAWVDEDDLDLKVSLTSDRKLHKLRDAPTDEVVGGKEYERRLRRQFERINPTPSWATKARKSAKASTKRAHDGQSVSSGEESDLNENDLFSTTSGILKKRRARVLEPNTLAIERLRDANQAAPAEGSIRSIHFHPSPLVPVLLSASADRRARLYNIDGHTNPHLHTIHIPDLPLTSAFFHPDGSTVMLTSTRPYFYTYDLQSGATRRSPRSLWGTSFDKNTGYSDQRSMELCAFDPSGEILAVAGRQGYIHLVDWKAGSEQVIASLKLPKAGINDIWWARGPSVERKTLMTLGKDSQVLVWDVGQRQCVRKWTDEGGFGGNSFTGDKSGNYLAVGSTTGFVNVYKADDTRDMIGQPRNPKPLKSIGNLVTAVSAMRINHDAQLMAIASNDKKDQMRMIHMPSMNAFSSWPTTATPLGHVNSIDFSPGSEYVAMGNNRGKVLLYHLKHYGAS